MLWVFPVATVWSAAVFSHQPGDSNGVVIAMAVFPVLWLVESFIQVFGLPRISGEVVQAVVVCISGIVVLGVVGVFQDLLRVPRPRWIVAVYLIATLASFLLIPCIAWIFGPVVGGVLPGILGLLFMLVALPNIVCLFGIGSIVVYTLAAMTRGVRKG
jgi:hypothetical protein